MGAPIRSIAPNPLYAILSFFCKAIKNQLKKAVYLSFNAIAARRERVKEGTSFTSEEFKDELKRILQRSVETDEDNYVRAPPINVLVKRYNDRLQKTAYKWYTGTILGITERDVTVAYLLPSDREQDPPVLEQWTTSLSFQSPD